MVAVPMWVPQRQHPQARRGGSGLTVCETTDNDLTTPNFASKRHVLHTSKDIISYALVL